MCKSFWGKMKMFYTFVKHIELYFKMGASYCM